MVHSLLFIMEVPRSTKCFKWNHLTRQHHLRYNRLVGWGRRETRFFSSRSALSFAELNQLPASPVRLRRRCVPPTLRVSLRKKSRKYIIITGLVGRLVLSELSKLIYYSPSYSPRTSETDFEIELAQYRGHFFKNIICKRSGHCFVNISIHQMHTQPCGEHAQY